MTPSEVLIRPAEPADVPAIAAMIRALADYEKLSHLVCRSEQDLQRALFGPAPAAEVLIAEVDSRSGRIRVVFPHFLDVPRPARSVARGSFRLSRAPRAGVGSGLLQAVAAIAQARDCGRFEWAVLDWNTPAIAFYERLGATVMADWRIARVTGAALERLASGSVR